MKFKSSEYFWKGNKCGNSEDLTKMCTKKEIQKNNKIMGKTKKYNFKGEKYKDAQKQIKRTYAHQV